MSTAWDVAIAFIFRAEGGIVNDPDDRGGLTHFGITEVGLKNAIDHGDVPYTLQLVDVSKTDALLIYQGIWRRLRCNDLPPAVALCVFDAGVLQGEGRAARWLQEALVSLGAHVAPDGVIGFRTVSAAQAVPAADLLHALLFLRRGAIDALILAHPEQQKFRRGWANRLRALGDACLGLLEARA